MFTELLSPAKDKETAFEAINAGADAVYIGAPSFGARHNASNSLEDIRSVAEYAHRFWAKVFVTVNTILTDDELEQAVLLVRQLQKIAVDAIIVQDLGLLKRINEDETINIPIHMSTQCDNRDFEKISFWNDLGVSRVVLARELSLDAIKEIHKRNPNIELEAFVHGALCVSYSGQCYLSHYIGGRSANRGECAQPCRKKYNVLTDKDEIVAKNIHALCLKDFNASKHLETMVKNGIFSFKIEGRLKDKNYVKNITAFYRCELDKYSQKTSSGRSTYSFEPNPEKSFNRGFTDYFLDGRKDCFQFSSPKSQGEYIGEVVEVKKDCFRIKTKKVLHPQDGLMFDTDGFSVNKAEGNLIYPNKKINLKVGTRVFRNYDSEYEKQLELPIKRQIGIKVEAGSKIRIVDEDKVSIEFDYPAVEPAKNQEKMNETFIKQFSKTGESDFYIEEIKITADIPFMPVSQINQLRRDAFESLIKKRIAEYKRNIQAPLSYTKYYKESVDYRANVHNKEAEEFLKICGSEVEEYSFESKIPKRQVELMRTKHCIKYALGRCKTPESLILEDEFGKKYRLEFDCKRCEMAVLSPL